MRQSSSMRVERDVAVEMRDGTVLYADVYRPDDSGRHPVLLQRTTYNKQLLTLALVQTDTLRAVERGYAVVIQDVRGRYQSEGIFNPFHQEMADGYDSVEWCAQQSWSDGQVGMYGTSYVGAVQWLAAVATPPSLKAIVPTFTASDYYEGWTYQGGAFQWGFMCNWILPYVTSADLLRHNAEQPRTDFEAQCDRLIAAIDNMDETIRILPLSDIPIGRDWSPYFFEWLAHPSRDDFWKSCSIEERHDRVRVPALNVGGWYDIFLDGTLRNFNGVREQGATREARDGARLLLGPWTHATPPAVPSGQVDFGVRAGQGFSPLSFNVDDLCLRFFDYWLKGIDDGFTAEAPIRLFVMGENVWRDEQEWPLARTRFTDFYLHSCGDANSVHGDGKLSQDSPGEERPDHFLYDPFHPVPSAGGQLCCYPTKLPPGAFDQKLVEERMDVLVFKTEPLDEDVEVTGPVTLSLWAATSAPDTDFTAKLAVLFPDGSSRNLTDGIIRTRYRQGTDRPRPITPGEAYEYTIDLSATSHLFRRGDRIALEVSSSNFPRFDRNLNTGHELGVDAEMRPALQTIFHDRERSSRLILPLIPR